MQTVTITGIPGHADITFTVIEDDVTIEITMNEKPFCGLYLTNDPDGMQVVGAWKDGETWEQINVQEVQ